MDSRPPEKNFVPRKGIIRILSARNKHLFRTEQNFLPRKKNINLFSGRKISLDLLASKAIWNIFRALRWFCGSSQQPNPQQQPLGISPALFHLFSQKRDQFGSPVFGPVMSPDFGSPPQRDLSTSSFFCSGASCMAPAGHRPSASSARIPAQRLVSRGHKRAKSVFQSNCYLYIAFFRYIL